MYIKYTDEQLICSTFAKYKVGEIVTALADVQCKYGMIEAGTELKVTQVTINEDVFLPKILQSELHKYISNYDEYTFVYNLEPIDTKDSRGAITLDSSHFEHSTSAIKSVTSQYKAKTKNRKKAFAIIQRRKTLPPLLFVFAVSSLSTLLLITGQSISDSDFMWTLFASIVGSLALAIAALAGALILLYMMSKKLEPYLIKWLYGHLLVKSK